MKKEMQNSCISFPKLPLCLLKSKRYTRGMYIHVRAIVGAKDETIVEKKKDHFLVQVKAKAERNMANKRIIEMMAAHFTLPLNEVRIISGHHSPSKILSIGR
jgi:uncharacterized protein YggU (UPF0235/DUF167 family)